MHGIINVIGEANATSSVIRTLNITLIDKICVLRDKCVLGVFVLQIRSICSVL